jgi:HEAT repeat protein
VLRLARLGLCAASLLAARTADAAPRLDAHVATPAEVGRWPTWPTEIDEIAAPLRDPSPKSSQERDREQALRTLEGFATEVIAADVVAALEDTATQVRREALRICYERRISACTPGAVTIWTNHVDPPLRTAALKVLAVDPDPAHVAILLAALRESNDHVRADAARFLGWAALTPAGRRDARAALVAKLGDISALVRQRAVQSLGVLGSHDATLAIARLLDDPEPAVRSAAAEALARGRDARAAPALIRAVDGMNEPMVTKALVEALAQLPGRQVAQELLARFDDPPTGLTSRQIADAIGNRPDPEPILIEGLVTRFREHALRPAALGALLIMGEAATEALREAERRGLSPAVAIEVRRLIEASTMESRHEDAPSEVLWPHDGDHPGWVRALSRGPQLTRLQAARRLADHAPAWMDQAIAAELHMPGPLASRRPWVLALIVSKRAVDLDIAAWTVLEGWAIDRRLAVGDRCLAASALGAATRRTDRRRARAALTGLLDDPNAAIRTCAVLPLARVDDGAATRIEPLLLDEAATVRTNAALALATIRLSRSTRARLHLLASTDPRAEVRAAAGVALLDARIDGRPTWLTRDEPEAPWSGLPHWLAVEGPDRTVWVPLQGSGRHRWALVPDLNEALGRVGDSP